MLLALLADTHDNPWTTRGALAIFKRFKPDAYLHAGDLVSPSMLKLFAGLPFHFVFGNNEADHEGLRARALAEGLHCHDNCAELTFAGKRIAMVHGHDAAEFQRVAAPGAFHYVIHGHSHVRRDERVGGTRIINPGALHRARIKSVALLNLIEDSVTFLDLPTGLSPKIPARP